MNEDISSTPRADSLREDDIRTSYHPKSGRPTVTKHFEDYGHDENGAEHAKRPVNQEPWRPFRCRLDFEVSELALDAKLNRRQTDRLLALIHRVKDGEAFTLKNSADVIDAWDNASSSLTSVGLAFTWVQWYY